MFIDDLRKGDWLVIAPTEAAFARLGRRAVDRLFDAREVEPLIDLAEHYIKKLDLVREPDTHGITFPRGLLPGPGAAGYHASKAYVLILGQAIAYELRHAAVTVTVLCSGATRTGYAEAASATRSKIVRGSMMAPTMLPEAVARIPCCLE